MNDQRFDEEALTNSLQLLADEMAGLDAPPEIEQKLREAFRARAAATAASRSYTPYWLLAAAAVLLIVVGLVAFRLNTDPRHEKTVAEGAAGADRQEQTQPQRLPVPVEEPQVKEPEHKQQVAQRPRRRFVRRPANTEVANHVTREIATDFMPLGYLNAATLQDGGQIVRVELPRSALVNFGLPVNMDRYNEKVKADVLLGVDGMAHAIRFVQ